MPTLTPAPAQFDWDYCLETEQIRTTHLQDPTAWVTSSMELFRDYLAEAGRVEFDRHDDVVIEEDDFRRDRWGEWDNYGKRTVVPWGEYVTDLGAADYWGFAQWLAGREGTTVPTTPPPAPSPTDDFLQGLIAGIASYYQIMYGVPRFDQPGGASGPTT